MLPSIYEVSLLYFCSQVFVTFVKIWTSKLLRIQTFPQILAISHNGSQFFFIAVKICPKIGVTGVSKGPVTLCNFLSNLSRNAIARQVAGELHNVTWVVSQFFCWAMRCTIAAIDNTIAQCITPPAEKIA